jgi:hypothetical protein
MRARIWNIRGYRAPGRRTQIKDFISREHLDFVGLQETIKDAFTPSELLAIDPLGKFAWQHTPALGRSGGMLLGVNEDTFEVLAWKEGRFFIQADVVQLDSSRRWSFVCVYGPADHRRSTEFLTELTATIHACTLPVVVGGDQRTRTTITPTGHVCTGLTSALLTWRDVRSVGGARDTRGQTGSSTRYGVCLTVSLSRWTGRPYSPCVCLWPIPS